MMGEIAEGIAAAGKLLPEASRSEVGALAVHRASVDIAFELSSQASTETGTIGIGARTFLFGPSVETGSNEQTAHNTGRITLEIVAITEPERRTRPRPDPEPEPDVRPVLPSDERPIPAPDEPPPDDPGPVDLREPESLRLTIKRMQEALPDLDISDAERKQVAALLEMAAAALAAGNLGAARDIITQLAPGFVALGRGADRTPER